MLGRPAIPMIPLSASGSDAHWAIELTRRTDRADPIGAFKAVVASGDMIADIMGEALKRYGLPEGTPVRIELRFMTDRGCWALHALSGAAAISDDGVFQ